MASNNAPPRCLFLNPPVRGGTIYMKEIGRCGRKSIGGELWPQTGLAYLAAVARERDCTVTLHDAMTLGWDWKETLTRAEEFNPDLVVILATTPTFPNDAAFVSVLRERVPKARIGLVGTHVTALPGESLAKSRADFVLLGEAEETLGEIVERWGEDLDSVDSVGVLRDGEVVLGTRRPLIEPLDSLPDPARDLLPVSRYTMPFTEGRPFATVIPSRGCPFLCTFCRAGDVWGRKVRVRSPERVVKELIEIGERFSIRDVTFMTDTLLANRDWALSLFREMSKAHLGTQWIGNARADQVDPELLDAMKRSGCSLMSYGIESGSQEMLDSMKKHLTLQQCLDGVRMTKEAGITAFAYFILGMPGETKETIQESIDFARRLDADYVNFHIATPFPGTEFYRQAKESGWLINDKWEDYEEEGSAVVSYPNLSAKELVAAQKRAMALLYATPSRLFKEILSIRSFSDLIAKCRAGVRMVRLLYR
ncbi:MAG: radical SAM protein [bacterium]